MKCSSITLTNKKDYNNRRTNQNQKSKNESKSTVLINKPGSSEENQRLLSTRTKFRSNQQPTLVVTNIKLPDNCQSFNTGSSLEKWSKKPPRLKSSSNKTRRYQQEFEKNLAAADTDDVAPLSPTVNDAVDEGFVENDELIISEELIVNSDIQELIRKSQRVTVNNEEGDYREKSKRRRKKRKDKMQLSSDRRHDDSDDKSLRKKVKLKKTIKFSLSKPPSPQTEQVIRVDVTSNMSVESYHHHIESAVGITYDCNNKDHVNMINDDNRMELKRNLNEIDDDGGVENNDDNKGGKDDDFIIVRCRQLALKQRRRR